MQYYAMIKAVFHFLSIFLELEKVYRLVFKFFIFSKENIIVYFTDCHYIFRLIARLYYN